MSKQRAEQLIVISLVVLLVSSVAGNLAEGRKDTKKFAKRITGGFLAMFFAALIAEVAPLVGAALAVATATNAFLKDGLPAINKRFEQKEKPANLRNPKERLPATPGPEVVPEPLGEVSPLSTPSPTRLGEFV